jgi:hypothetical protein
MKFLWTAVAALLLAGCAFVPAPYPYAAPDVSVGVGIPVPVYRQGYGHYPYRRYPHYPHRHHPRRGW